MRLRGYGIRPWENCFSGDAARFLLFIQPVVILEIPDGIQDHVDANLRGNPDIEDHPVGTAEGLRGDVTYLEIPYDISLELPGDRCRSVLNRPCRYRISPAPL